VVLPADAFDPFLMVVAADAAVPAEARRLVVHFRAVSYAAFQGCTTPRSDAFHFRFPATFASGVRPTVVLEEPPATGGAAPPSLTAPQFFATFVTGAFDGAGHLRTVHFFRTSIVEKFCKA
jgi:hypothetical protein